MIMHRFDFSNLMLSQNHNAADVQTLKVEVPIINTGLDCHVSGDPNRLNCTCPCSLPRVGGVFRCRLGDHTRP